MTRGFFFYWNFCRHTTQYGIDLYVYIICVTRGKRVRVRVTRNKVVVVVVIVSRHLPPPHRWQRRTIRATHYRRVAIEKRVNDRRRRRRRRTSDREIIMQMKWAWGLLTVPAEEEEEEKGWRWNAGWWYTDDAAVFGRLPYPYFPLNPPLSISPYAPSRLPRIAIAEWSVYRAIVSPLVRAGCDFFTPFR